MSQHDLQAWIVPSSGPHQSEYVAERFMAREWISGFSGSAGTAVVTHSAAGLWTDGRYFLQAESQLADNEFELHRKQTYNIHEYHAWISEHLNAGDRVGIDGRLLSIKDYEYLSGQFADAEIELVTSHDLIEEIWTDRPGLPQRPVFAHSEDFAGESRSHKLLRLRQRMAEEGCGSTLLSALDDIAWLLNLRGNDIEFSPVFYAYVLVGTEEVYLFTHANQLSPDLQTALEADGIVIQPYDGVVAHLNGLNADLPLRLDPQQATIPLVRDLDPDAWVAGKSLVVPMKAQRNETEIANTRNAMEKDGVALVHLFRWLEKELEAGNEPSEYEVAMQLAGFRSQQADYKGESFPAIAGYAGNGAVIHYRPMEESAARIKAAGIFLLDSGGQYLDGTTDVTRTVALGVPTAAQKEHYTLVLKGHIGVSRLVFPEGTQGQQIDILARQHLWRAGLNYGHGTGHGVGFFLNVHEGPQGIGPSSSGRSTTPFLPGMVTSNEPGFYLEGAYGIRIENLVLVVPADLDSDRDYFRFEDLTLYPMDWQLIDEALLDAQELEWLKAYHQEVYARLAPRLDAESQAWLHEKCFPE